MIFHALTQIFSSLTNMAFIFDPVPASPFETLIPNVGSKEHQEDCTQTNDNCNKHWWLQIT